MEITAEPLEIDERLVSLFAPNSYEAEKYRALAHTIELMHKATGLQVLAVTSPTPGDGKTTTTINLAGALAQSPEARVLLMCADLRKPSVIEHLGMDHPHPRGLLEEAQNLIDPSKLVGLVFNYDDNHIESYYYYNYLHPDDRLGTPQWQSWWRRLANMLGLPVKT